MGVIYNHRDGTKTLRAGVREATLALADLDGAETDVRVRSRLEAARKTSLQREIEIAIVSRTVNGTNITLWPLGQPRPPVIKPLDLGLGLLATRRVR